MLEGSVASAAAGGSGAHRRYGSTVAKLVQPMESKTPGSARNAQESDERWPALANAQNLSYTLKVNGHKVSANHLLICCTFPQRKVSTALAMRSRWVSHRRKNKRPRVGSEDLRGPTTPTQSSLQRSAGLMGSTHSETVFANELGRRDYVTGEMWKNKPPVRLAFNAATDEIAWHYTGRRVMKFYESGAALAQDPDGGPYAYPSGKSWTKLLARRVQGRSSTMLFREPILPHGPTMSQLSLLSSIIAWVMRTQFWGADSKPVAAVEFAGGVHGNSRLGGNSLQDCVVLGRVASAACAKYVLSDRVKATSHAALAGVEDSKSDQAIVVGGLAGMSAARVVLLDKSSFCGGNSAKATIDGARTQREKDSADSSDTLKGDAKKPELAKLRKLSSFQCARRCKSRALRSAAKRELCGVTLLTSVHSCGCPLGLAAHEVAAA